MAYKKKFKKGTYSKKRGGARKKYSFNERAEYHRSRDRAFADKFRYSPKPGYSSIHFDEMEKAYKKDKRIQYSNGFNDFVNGRRLEEKATPAEKSGYEAAKKLKEKALNYKF